MGIEERAVLILGARSLSVEIADLVSDVPGFRPAGFVENMDRDKCGEELDGLPIHWVDELENLAADHWALCGLATTHRRRFVDQVVPYGIRFATLVHPTARISTRSSAGEGSVVSVGSIVAAHTTLGRHVLVNRGALIGHHTSIGDFTTIQPGANIAGACRIGSGVFVGMGSVIMDHVTVGDHSVVGAGAVVTKDVPERVQVLGIPARVTKEGIDGK